MALKHFASQIQNKKPAQSIQQQAPVTPVPQAANPTLNQAEPVMKPASRLAKLEAMRVSNAGNSAQKTSHTAQENTQTSAAPAGILKSGEAATGQANAYGDDGANHTLQEIPLTWTDQQMLCALSAMQIRYGRPNEAIPYLMMIRKINPKNLECCRLLALAFMRLKRWHEADAMIAEYEYLQQSTQSNAMDGVIMLYRSLVAFKTNRITDAKNWFGKFRSLNKVT